MTPFVHHFLENLAPLIVRNIKAFKNAGQFGKIFEIMGTMLCDVTINLD